MNVDIIRTQPQIYQLLEILPVYPVETSLSFRQTEGKGTLRISDESGRFLATTDQDARDFADGRMPNEIYIRSEREANFCLIKNAYLRMAQRQGYTLTEGTLVFKIGCNGNPANGDNLHWNDSFLTIAQNKLHLELGDRISLNERETLVSWFR